ncbi:MAG: DedA family protein [Bacteriovoracaceae bacterium]
MRNWAAGGFFLPGDSLLVTAGVFTVTNGAGGAPFFNLYTLLIVITIAAVVGDQVGFYLGMKAGPKIFNREDSLFFKKKYLISAQNFFIMKMALRRFLCRFVPIFRTFVPFTAGLSQMNYLKFIRVNIISGVVWVFSMVLLGHFLGQTPRANKLHKVIVLIVFISVIPVIVTAFKNIVLPYCRQKFAKS